MPIDVMHACMYACRPHKDSQIVLAHLPAVLPANWAP